MFQSSQPQTVSQPNTPTPGARVSTPAGIGTLEAVADVYKRGSDTEVRCTTALVFVNGKRRAFDVCKITVLS